MYLAWYSAEAIKLVMRSKIQMNMNEKECKRWRQNSIAREEEEEEEHFCIGNYKMKHKNLLHNHDS